MANIPGISGFVQPGAFARDRVISSGVSIPGGVRIVCVMGEGLREQTLVDSAAGGGLDGDSTHSPTGSGDGRYFKISNAPLISGRTEVRLNGALLYGTQQTVGSSDSLWDTNGFDTKFDFRLDFAKGALELQGAYIKDQGGSGYSASSSNVGDGFVVEETCGTSSGAGGSTLQVLDTTAPPERWTLRCVAVKRDASGNPVSGNATFTATGSKSGQVYDSSGNARTFTSSYHKITTGAVSGNVAPGTDGLVVVNQTVGTGVPTLVAGDTTSTTTNKFVVEADLIAHGQALAGDHLVISSTAYQIKSIAIGTPTDSTDTTKSTITLTTDSLGGVGSTVSTWEVRATNVLIDGALEDHDVSGNPLSSGIFSSQDVGKVAVVCSGGAEGKYVITKITSSRRARIHKYGDSTSGFPDLQEADYADGIADDDLTVYLLETNGTLLLGIKESTTPFEVGDKFYVDVSGRALGRGDSLEVRYISEADLNDPEFFTDASEMFKKHGFPNESNTLSLGAQMAMENGAPGILALQCKPAIPRRTSSFLIEERDSLGNGGFAGCYSSGSASAAACEVDDLRFIVPVPITGIRKGRPDADTRVNLFVVRNGIETQIFPNKVDFYNSQLESATQQTNFISSSDFAFSYTIVNTGFDILGDGIDADLASDTGGVYFQSTEFDLDGSMEATANETTIVITSMEHPTNGTVYTKASEIAKQLFDDDTAKAEIKINTVASDKKAYVTNYEVGKTLSLTAGSYKDIQFFVKDVGDTTNVDAALLLHNDIVDSGVLQVGDGLKITYVDENDADHFDTNWFNAFEKLESADTQIVVPLPTSAKSSIFRAAVNHCENMSSVANRKERLAFIGAIAGVTAAALIGTEEVAVEDIGILEGIQGDDASEVLDQNIEDLVNFKLSDNFTSNRCVYFWPDEIVRNVNGTNIALDGFYVSACAAGFLSSKQNVAIPLTNKSLSGFSILRSKVERPVILNSLGNVGATVLQPVSGGGRILAGRTTSNSGYVEDEEISIMFIRDKVKQVMRSSLKGFVGGVQSEDTNMLISNRTGSILNGLVQQGLITGYRNVRVSQDKVDPRQVNVFLQFTPAYPINYVFIDIEVGII